MFGWLKKTPETQKKLTDIDSRSLWTRIFDWTANAWQTHAPYDTDENGVFGHPIVFTCQTLIAADIGKLPPKIQKKSDGYWPDVDDHPKQAILERPNTFQNHIQFKENWMMSRLSNGNTYVLKVRDSRRNVIGLRILDPLKVQPLIAENGDIFYRLSNDPLQDIDEQYVAPSTDVVHDRTNCFFHPLVGLPPIFAAAMTAQMGQSVIKNSRYFFKNGAKISGILSAPGSISDEVAKRMKAHWDEKFSGENAGKVAVLGDGLKYETMQMTNLDAQVVEHLGISAEMICSTYHVPRYMAGVGPDPSFNNIETLIVQYYSQCLQSPIESFELLMKQALELAPNERIHCDLDTLMRMDQSTLIKALRDAKEASLIGISEGRSKLNLKPVQGGDEPLTQQQYVPLSLVSKFHEQAIATGAAPKDDGQDDEDEASNDEIATERALEQLFAKGIDL